MYAAAEQDRESDREARDSQVLGEVGLAQPVQLAVGRPDPLLGRLTDPAADRVLPVAPLDDARRTSVASRRCAVDSGMPARCAISLSVNGPVAVARRSSSEITGSITPGQRLRMGNSTGCGIP